MAFTLRARWVLSIARPPIPGGYVAVEGERILAVENQAPSGVPIFDLGDAILMPGLVNAHTHLEFSGLSSPLGTPGMSLPDWIRLVIGDRKRGDREPAAAIVAGVRECLRSGVTSIGEIATSPAADYSSMSEQPTIVKFQEAIGFSGGRVESVFADIERRLAKTPPPTGASPHAPYTVHPQLVSQLVRLARVYDVPVAMHLAESPEELELLATGNGPFRDLLDERSMWDGQAIPQGSRPLDYLRQLAEAPRAMIIHGNYLEPDEIDFIAQHRQRMSVVYCPRTHEYFAHDPYPLEAMLAAGVRVALGTDSRASSPDLNLWNELRCVWRKAFAGRAETLVEMATLSGAEALGLAGEVGSLSPGKRADLIALPCDATVSDPSAFLFESAESPSHVWLAGREITDGLREV